MGEWYDFDIKIIDGKEVSGFSYSNENTGWNEIFVEMTEGQCDLANQWQDKLIELHEIKDSMIKEWIKSK